jgi:hypothetical protein
MDLIPKKKKKKRERERERHGIKLISRQERSKRNQ